MQLPFVFDLSYYKTMYTGRLTVQSGYPASCFFPATGELISTTVWLPHQPTQWRHRVCYTKLVLYIGKHTEHTCDKCWAKHFDDFEDATYLGII